jgi:hypothetical protein
MVGNRLQDAVCFLLDGKLLDETNDIVGRVFGFQDASALFRRDIRNEHDFLELRRRAISLAASGCSGRSGAFLRAFDYITQDRSDGRP